MKNKSPKNRLGKIGGRFFRRQLYFVITPLRRFRSKIIYGLYRFIPTRFRFMLPSLTKEAKDYFQEKLRQRGQDSDQDLTATEDALDLAALKQERLQLLPQPNSNYLNYRCLEGEPLSCFYAQQTIEDSGQISGQIKYCRQCGFPKTLPVHAEIVGNQGRYRITDYVNMRGRGRIYQGIKIGNEQPVTIKEYLLPNRHFNQEEKYYTHNAFKNQGSIDLVDGRKQDFRLTLKADAISPPPPDRLIQSARSNNTRQADRERCYLVTPGNLEQLPTLRLYLAEQGKMSGIQVHQVLNQILQTLESLHNQKFRLPTGRIQTGMAHGNLSLESVLIAWDSRPFFEQSQLTIYLSDLALWSDLFQPPPYIPRIDSPIKDLVALGYIAFYLLIGQSVDQHGFTLRPHSDRHWADIDPKLKNFIFRLLEINTPFASAFAARQALLKLQLKSTVIEEKKEESTIIKSSKGKKSFWQWILLAILLLILTLGGYWWSHLQRQPAIAESHQPTICCIADIAGIPQGKFSYTAEKIGIWNYVLQQKNLILKDLTLKTKLADKTPQFHLDYVPDDTQAESIAKIQQGKADFGIISAIDPLDNDLSSEIFAYDGLTFFVAFSDRQKKQNLLQALKGRITFDQLRQLYTGQITNWKQLGGVDLPVKLYMPTSPLLIQLFETKVLRDQKYIETFRYLWQQSDQINLVNSEFKEITQLPILPMLRQILPEFEDEQIGSIGFGSLSRVFGQCSVYPLALDPDEDKAIQPLIQDNMQPINPKLDLCKDKGSYQINQQLFQTNTYPLTYPLAVVYPKDNSLPPAGQKFAEILNTDEGQKLLTKTGLISRN